MSPDTLATTLTYAAVIVALLTLGSPGMNGPSLGSPSNAPLATIVTSALAVPYSPVRRRVSGPHTIPNLHATGISISETGVKAEDGRRVNSSSDIRGAVQQRKLPAPGRELFSDDEDEDLSNAPLPGFPISRRGSRPLPPIPADEPVDDCLLHQHGETITRFPTPNFAVVHNDVQRAHDLDTRPGLSAKVIRPFKMLKSQLEAGNNPGGAVECDADSLSNQTEVGGQSAGFRALGQAGLYAKHTSTVSSSGNSSLSRRDTTTSEGSYITAVSGPPNTNTVRLIGVEAKPHSRHTAKSTRFLDVPEQEQDEGDAVSDVESSSEGLLNRQAPHSPALLAATHTATDRFTRRFPVSLSHRKANCEGAVARNRDPDEHHLLPLLGYGETGAIVEWPSAWMPEKWALLFSVCSVRVLRICPGGV